MKYKRVLNLLLTEHPEITMYQLSKENGKHFEDNPRHSVPTKPRIRQSQLINKKKIEFANPKRNPVVIKDHLINARKIAEQSDLH